MATEEKNSLQTLLDFITGAITTLGIEGGIGLVKEQIQKKAGEKAHELFVDNGERIDILIDIAQLMLSDDEKKCAAGKKVLEYFIEAQNKHEEQEINSLLRKFPPDKADKRIIVLQVLGGLENYDRFRDAITSTLKHDNALQVVLKTAERMDQAGGAIASKDARAVMKVTGAVAQSARENSLHAIDAAAGAVLPAAQKFLETLKKRRVR